MIYINKEFSHAIKKVPKSGGFRSQEEFGSEIQKYLPSPEELSFSKNVLSKVKSKLLYARIDFLNIDGAPHLMELELVEPALYFRMSDGPLNNFIKGFAEFL